MKLNIQSEIGKLNGVILHTPGAEVENMTPQNAQRALYSDILNLDIARHEYAQLEGVLSKVTNVYQVRDLLSKVLRYSSKKDKLIKQICKAEDAEKYYEYLMSISNKELSRVLIEGLPATVDTLTSFLGDDYYALHPLYNFYFTRDASVTIGNDVLICKMASKVRLRESLIMEAIFEDSGEFECGVLNAREFTNNGPDLYIEGGDVLIARDDILIIGNGMRTSTLAIDKIVESLCKRNISDKQYVIVQQLPHTPESFIHLDMVFTMLDVDSCMIFEPLILKNNIYQTVQITIENGKVSNIKNVENILSALRKLGMDLKPVICGGTKDVWDQEREQWHSGANTFAFAPGKILAYARNSHTLEALSKNDFEVYSANDVINDKVDIEQVKRCVITLDGSELPRGGGGARCMTMPLHRDKVNW